MPQFQTWLSDEDYSTLLKIKDVSESASKAIARMARERIRAEGEAREQNQIDLASMIRQGK